MNGQGKLLYEAIKNAINAIGKDTELNLSTKFVDSVYQIAESSKSHIHIHVEVNNVCVYLKEYQPETVDIFDEKKMEQLYGQVANELLRALLFTRLPILKSLSDLVNTKHQ